MALIDGILIMSPREEILATLGRHSLQLKALGVKKAGLFGSFGASRQKATSDIDILIEFRHGYKSFDNYMELKFFLERLFRRKIDLVLKEALKPRIKGRVLSEAKYARL